MREVVHKLLTQLRREIFSDSGSGFEHHHRVTLFRHKEHAFVRRRWPWNGWLVPELRSGATTQNPSRCFKASSDNPDHAEGIAGMAWVSDADVYVHSLPIVSNGQASDTDIEAYAAATGMSAAAIREMKPKGRSFYGIRVEGSGGERWGVIVVDSVNVELRRRRIEGAYAKVAPSLAVLLQRV